MLGYELPNLGGFSLYGETVLLGEYSSVLDMFLFERSGHKKDDLKIMQFTGLKDKNGKEIYEGDILRFAKVVVPYYGKNKGKEKTLYDYWEVFWYERGEWRGMTYFWNFTALRRGDTPTDVMELLIKELPRFEKHDRSCMLKERLRHALID